MTAVFGWIEQSMSTLIVILAVMLACSLVAGIGYWYAMRHRPPLAKPLPFISPPCRKLTDEERAAVEKYIASLGKARQHSSGRSTRSSREPEALALTAQSNNVYPVTRSITRYGLSTTIPTNGATTG